MNDLDDLEGIKLGYPDYHQRMMSFMESEDARDRAERDVPFAPPYADSSELVDLMHFHPYYASDDLDSLFFDRRPMA